MVRIGIGASDAPHDEDADYALQLALQCLRRGIEPVMQDIREPAGLDVLQRRALAPFLARSDAAAHAATVTFPVLHCLGEGLALRPGARRAPGQPDLGLASVEHGNFAPAAIARVADWPLLATASTWNARLLREQGLRNVLCCPAGIDPTRFHPAARAGLFSDRYLVYWSGRMEYSKGPDIVLTAFRAFRQRHPEALLVLAWAAPSHDGLRASPHSDKLPEMSGPALQIDAWLAHNGIGPEAVLFCGQAARSDMPAILRECDLALFPSRCEPGTNPRAMEALACGVPTILSGNSGHLDLAGEHVYMLKEQGAIARLQGWGESSVDEVLAVMEQAHARRGEALAKGKAAARFMRDWTWERQAGRLLDAIVAAAAGSLPPAPGVDDEYAWGLRLHRAGRVAEAERVYDAVLQKAPEHISGRGDRANARRDQGDLDGAEADFRAVLALRPGYPKALHSLGNLLRRRGQLTEAADCLGRAVAGMDTPALRWDLAFTLLLMGHYEQAWPHFEHRHAALGLRTADPAKPRWDGQPVSDATLLVLDEQGLGDTMQFLRFLPLIPVGPGGRVIFAGKPATLSAARRLLPAGDVFSWDAPLPRSQAWIPLMSLPARLGVQRPADLPPPAPAALADPANVARWRALVRGGDDLPVVGLCWRGNPDFPGDARRSPGLAVLQPILAVQGVRFVSLQVGPGRREIAELGLDARLPDLGAAIEAAGSDVLDTLAVLKNCDFVISCCTSVIHMAGVAGRPGRVLLPHSPDWRWMLGRVDTPWYPSLRLVRQAQPGDWAGVAAETASQLRLWRDSHARSSFFEQDT